MRTTRIRSRPGTFAVCTAVGAAATPTSVAIADDLHVPSEYPTIAAAVAASAADDHVVLADGVHQGAGNHDITLPSHAITIRSGSGVAANCIIQLTGDPPFSTQRAFEFTPSSSSDSVIEDITIRGGTGDRTGGAMLIEGASPTIRSCVFEDNWVSGDACVTSYGGAIYLKDSGAMLDGCIFIGNLSSPDFCSGTGPAYGGAVHISGGAPTVVDCEFSANRVWAAEVETARGGAISAADGAELLVVRSSFHNNHLGGGGGVGAAIWVQNAAVDALECLFEGNQAGGRGFPFIAASAGGGAAYVGPGGHLTLMNCELFHNSASPLIDGFASGGGGAVSVDSGTVAIINSVLADNVTFTPDPCDSEFGTGGFGGALNLKRHAVVVVQSSTIVDNSAQCAGDAIYLSAWQGGGSRLEVANSIIWGSAEPIDAAAGSAEIQFSAIQGGWPGEGNIDADPMLGHDYRLAAGSPAADAGANDLVPPDIFDLDGDGNVTEPLPLDLAGNRRFADDPAAPDTGRGTRPIVDMGAYETPGDFCYADCDSSGSLDFFDFLCFQNLFAAGDPQADCDNSGDLDFFDFLCFQNAFTAGCP